MATRCNRGFYCRSYCLLNMFRAPLCTSSWLCVRFAGCCSILQTGHITLSSTPDQQLENHSTKYHRQQPLCNTLELLMMGIVVPETCWASNKICHKNLYFVHIKVKRLAWAGYLMRMSDERTLKKIFNTKPGGTRSVGRPKLRWEDGVAQDTQILGVKRWKNAALNRDEWAKLLKKARVHQGLSSQWWWW